jgi:hypothetical protein
MSDLVAYCDIARRIALLAAEWIRLAEAADRRGEHGRARLLLDCATDLAERFPELDVGCALLARDIDAQEGRKASRL